MPYAKTIEINSVPALKKILNYLQNQSHKNHGPKGYTVDPMQSAHPDLTPQNFVEKAERALAQINGQNRSGRKVENLATLHIVRTPYDTYLTARERYVFAWRYVREVVADGLAVLDWHWNPTHGSDDLNVLVMNTVSLDLPRTRRQRNISPYGQARRVSDQITEQLNARRKVLDQELIVTMDDIHREVAKDRRGHCLEEELAAHKGRVTLKNLRKLVEGLGHTINRFNPEKNYFTVRFKEAKPEAEIIDPKKRKRASRGTRFHITDVLEAVERLREQQREAKVTKAKALLGTFELPRDQAIDDMVGQSAPVRKPRRPQPPEHGRGAR